MLVCTTKIWMVDKSVSTKPLSLVHETRSLHEEVEADIEAALAPEEVEEVRQSDEAQSLPR